jgi:transposase
MLLAALHQPQRLKRLRTRSSRTTILHIARTDCQWRLLPKDFPPFTTVQGFFYDWRDQGLFERINFERCAGEPSPSAGIIDGQAQQKQS